MPEARKELREARHAAHQEDAHAKVEEMKAKLQRPRASAAS
jgi:hypothetical protein